MSEPIPSPLRYGQIYRIKNGYKNWNGGYLDSCGGAGCGGNLYGVSTSKTSDRAGVGTTFWKIMSATKRANGTAVMALDLIYLENQYNVKKGYLDTCGGADCGGNLWGVSIAESPDRAQKKTGTWKIIPEHGWDKNQGKIMEDEVVHLQNGYQNWNGGFLDTCGGATCGGNLYLVSTSGKYNRSGLTTQWKFHEV